MSESRALQRNSSLYNTPLYCTAHPHTIILHNGPHSKPLCMPFHKRNQLNTSENAIITLMYVPMYTTKYIVHTAYIGYTLGKVTCVESNHDFFVCK